MLRKKLMPAALLALVLGSWLAAGSTEAAGLVAEGNKGTEGQALELKSLVAPGKITLLDFWSVYCGPCRELTAIMEKVAEKRPDVSFVKLDINRPGVRGIDWKSPLAQQYKLHSIPYLMIFDNNGKLVAKGHQAFEMFAKWAKEAGL